VINSYELQWCKSDGSLRSARIDVDSQEVAEWIGQAMASALGEDVRILQIVRLCCAKESGRAGSKKTLSVPVKKTPTPPVPVKAHSSAKSIPENHPIPFATGRVRVTPPPGSPIVCLDCKETKSRSEFYWTPKNGVITLSYRRCKTCTSAYLKLSDTQRKARKRALRKVDSPREEDEE